MGDHLQSNGRLDMEGMSVTLVVDPVHRNPVIQRWINDGLEPGTHHLVAEPLARREIAQLTAENDLMREALMSIKAMRSDRPGGPYPKTYKGGFDAATDVDADIAGRALDALSRPTTADKLRIAALENAIRVARRQLNDMQGDCVFYNLGSVLPEVVAQREAEALARPARPTKGRA